MRSGLSRGEVTAHKALVRDFFARYHETFEGIIRSGSDDLTPLLGYFALPLTVTTRETHLVITDAPALFEVFGTNVARQRAQHHERSVQERSDLRVLNDRAFLAEVDWVRRGKRGEPLSTLRMLYLGAETDAGPRIVHLVVVGEPPEDARVNPDEAPGAGSG